MQPFAQLERAAPASLALLGCYLAAVLQQRDGARPVERPALPEPGIVLLREVGGHQPGVPLSDRLDVLEGRYAPHLAAISLQPFELPLEGAQGDGPRML